MKWAIRQRVILFSIWVITSISFILSCSQVDTPSLPGDNKYPIHLSASPRTQTKISVDGTSLGWEASDILQITAVSSDGKSAVSDLSVYSIDNTNSHIASFTGFVTIESAPVDCYFTYPSGNAMSVDVPQGKVVARFNAQDGQHKPFLYSRVSYSSDGMETELKFAGAMLQITVAVEGVCSLAFFGNNFEDMFPLIIDPATGEYTKSDEMGYIIQVPVQSEGPTYICVPTVNLEDGFSIVLIDAQGHQMVRSFSDGSTGGYDLSNKAGYIIPITISGEFEGFGVTYSSLEYGHTYKENLLSGTGVSFIMDKSGVPNARIEEWGATLVDGKGNVVRKYVSNDGAALSNAKVSLGVEGNYKLLPAGDYVFSPYYKAYGQKVTLGSQVITIPDPGVQITLDGYTSYDKYTAGDITAANNCENTTIFDVSASINVHSDIIDSYVATLDGAEIGATSSSGSSKSFGDITRSTFKAYPYSVTVTVGNLTFSASRDFHITGLPLVVNFNGGNPGSWGVINGSFTGDCVEFNSSGQSALRSPKFHVPTGDNTKDLYVKTAFDGCGKNVYYKVPILNIVADKVEYLDIYFTTCASTQNSVVMGNSCVRAHYKVSYGTGGYLSYSPKMQLRAAKPCVMYSASNNLYTKAIYKVKVEYTE